MFFTCQIEGLNVLLLGHAQEAELGSWSRFGRIRLDCNYCTAEGLRTCILWLRPNSSQIVLYVFFDGSNRVPTSNGCEI